MPAETSSRTDVARAASAWRPEPTDDPIDRIRDRDVFRRFRAEGTRARRGPLTVAVLPRPDGPAALAFAISRRVGNAVARNRLRRQLRAAAGELERNDALVPAWYLVIVHPGGSRRSLFRAP